MASVPTARHLLRAKDLADAWYFEPLTVSDLARAAGLSRAHFSHEFRRAFGESPHAYLLTRRLERAAAMLRTTDRAVADVCFSVGLLSVGSFTASFTRTYGMPPTAYRLAFPSAADRALIPACIVRAHARPQHRTFREDSYQAGAWGDPRPFRRTQEDLVIRISNVQLWVHDQDEALAFYTQNLGMEVRADMTVAEMGNFRWLAVGPAGQPDVAIVLMAIPGAPVMNAETAEQVRGLMATGSRGRSSSRPATATPTTRSSGAGGVEFVGEPEERPYGIDASFRDPSGNYIRLTQAGEAVAV
jgi:AraC-like DNA-binding protein/predicted enzyme related to lactoylglutathione lyase